MNRVRWAPAPESRTRTSDSAWREGTDARPAPRRSRLWGSLLLSVLLPGCSDATSPPPTGAPGLDVFDSLMVAFVDEHGIGAAALGIMRDGEVVYEKAFGWKDRARSVPLPTVVMMRLASVSKPITAAAVRALSDGGLLDLDEPVFDVGQDEGGILDLEPFPSLGDARLGDVTVRHLLTHQGGWDRSLAGDLTYREIVIAEAMSVPSPPGRHNTLRYILGQPLEFAPGSRSAYSNIGFMVLGMVIEEVAGEEYLEYVHETVFEPLGVSAPDIVGGRTFPADRDPREPWYDDDATAPNVFDPTGPGVRRPDGSWHHEARIAQGGLVATPRTLLEFLEAFQVAGDAIGTRRNGSEGAGWKWHHTGSLPGTNALARQRGDGINYVVLLNRRATSGSSYVSLIRDDIDALLDFGGVQWPGPPSGAP